MPERGPPQTTSVGKYHCISKEHVGLPHQECMAAIGCVAKNFPLVLLGSLVLTPRNSIRESLTVLNIYLTNKWNYVDTHD